MRGAISDGRPYRDSYYGKRLVAQTKLPKSLRVNILLAMDSVLPTMVRPVESSANSKQIYRLACSSMTLHDRKKRRRKVRMSFTLDLGGRK